MSKSQRPKRRTARIRHKHDEARIPGLRDKMIADGIDALEVDMVFKDLGALREYGFLTSLSVRGLKQGIETIGQLAKLQELALWEIRGLDTGWMAGLSQIVRLSCYAVKFKNFCLPAPPNEMRQLSLTNCNGFGGVLDCSILENIETLIVDACGDICRISDCSRLERLKNVVISNIRLLDSLEGISAAPNLQSVTVQKTPKLGVADLEWMLTHPTLEEVYPALVPVKGGPILDEVQELLGPRFGDNLF